MNPEGAVGRKKTTSGGSPEIGPAVMRLREAARSKGVTSVELAARMGLTQGSVGPVLSGHIRPSLAWLYRAAAALGIKPSTLDERLTGKIPSPEKSQADY